jgi:hypothetical protein
MEDAPQNELEVANEQKMEAMSVRMYDIDVCDVDQTFADARALMDAIKPKYNNNQKKYSQDPEYQKYHNIMGDNIEGPYWNTDFAVKRY